MHVFHFLQQNCFNIRLKRFDQYRSVRYFPNGYCFHIRQAITRVKQTGSFHASYPGMKKRRKRELIIKV
jgi:hypothetical protein